jgi:hypothetical protein
VSYVPPVVDFIAKKIARVPGVELSAIVRDGAIDVVLEGGYNRPLRAHVLSIGQRAMVPVRVYYRMPDGRAIGEGAAVEEFEGNSLQSEAIEDYYTRIHVAGFAGAPPLAPPDEVAGDAYGDKDVPKDDKSRDQSGQLKLQRIRGTTRGRPVIGWAYGDHTVKQGCRVKFKKAAVLQWTMGRTLNVKAGAKGTVTSLASKRPIAYLSMGGESQIELPIHAVGHVYDVMVDPKLESARPFIERERWVSQDAVGSPYQPADNIKPVDNTTGYKNSELKRLVMTVGFGRSPNQDDTKKNTANFRGPGQPDLHGYTDVKVNAKGGRKSEAAQDQDDDMLVPKSAKPTDKPDDDRRTHVGTAEPKMTVRFRPGAKADKKKTVLLGRS